ncbi:MAG: methylated-DNA--[protein]-cysteine S-methyltransferase [Candidatus Neomarinimicrobiota bacterium]
MLIYDLCKTPYGTLTLVKSDRGICFIGLPNTSLESIRTWTRKHFNGEPLRHEPDCCRAEQRDLLEYFAGNRTEFTWALDHRNTTFAHQVLAELSKVQYGQTATYGELAAKIGRPRAARAVGGAVGANPLPIVIPCHRIVGSNGSLTGYGGGLPLKKTLLALETRPK